MPSHRTTKEERVLLIAICKYCSVEQVNAITNFVMEARAKEKINGLQHSKP
jgi:hypothetical protein